jgi:hypothetical protein
MSCEVCIGGGDYDGSPEFYTHTYHRARKAHKCCECGRAINIGERYEYFASKFDGDFDVNKTCHQCAEIRQVFSCGNEGPYYGQLWEEMRDNAFPNLTTASECFTELSASSKAFVLDKWRKWKGLV